MPSWPYQCGADARTADEAAFAKWQSQSNGLTDATPPPRTANKLFGITAKRWQEGYDRIPEFGATGEVASGEWRAR